jgi:hypothetical protein
LFRYRLDSGIWSAEKKHEDSQRDPLPAGCWLHKRLTVPEDVARCVAALCHPATYWMTGNTLHVDGGEHVVSYDELMTENGLPCLDLLEATPGILRALMTELTEADARWKPAPERFSVAEVLGYGQDKRKIGT